MLHSSQQITQFLNHPDLVTQMVPMGDRNKIQGMCGGRRSQSTAAMEDYSGVEIWLLGDLVLLLL